MGILCRLRESWGDTVRVVKVADEFLSEWGLPFPAHKDSLT